jgi:hypothetical protein
MTRQVYGFLYGIVYGFISLFVLIAKLYGVHIGLYAENNTGSLYWLGFILGLVLLLGGGGSSVASRRRRWRGNTLKMLCSVLEINMEDILDYGKTEDNKYIRYFHL